MTLSFLNKRSECTHQVKMRIEIAGMSREVCESCGKVSVGYVESHISPARAQVLSEVAATIATGCDD
jgi:hypothetical protein